MTYSKIPAAVRSRRATGRRETNIVQSGMRYLINSVAGYDYLPLFDASSNESAVVAVE